MIHKKVLIIGANISDSTSPRVMRIVELTKELLRQGHRVVLYIADHNKPNLLKSTDYQKLQIKSLGKKQKAFIQRKGLIFRIINKVLDLYFLYPSIEYYSLVKKTIKKEIGNQYDLMISVAVPHSIHWGCAALINKRNKQLLCQRWVADCGDPFMGELTAGKPRPFYFKYIEKYAFRKADYISVPLANAKYGYYEEFWPKLRVIPQGFNFEEIKLYDGVIDNKIPTFIYAGGFVKGCRDPYSLLEYLETLDCAFKFIVYTKSGGENFFNHISDKLKKNIEVKPYILRLELLYIMSQADFLVSFEYGCSIQQSPSKLIDYALAKRPILSIDSKKLDTSLVDEFLSGDYKRQFIVSNIEQYNIRNIAKEFISLS